MRIERLPIFIAAGAVTIGVATAAPKTVWFTCSDGTKVKATFSPPGPRSGAVKLVVAGSLAETTLPQVVSADGGRYAQGDIEFWTKGRGATLTRAGKRTTCKSRS